MIFYDIIALAIGTCLRAWSLAWRCFCLLGIIILIIGVSWLILVPLLRNSQVVTQVICHLLPLAFNLRSHAPSSERASEVEVHAAHTQADGRAGANAQTDKRGKVQSSRVCCAVSASSVCAVLASWPRLPYQLCQAPARPLVAASS
jgi:hypothetical protein